LDSSTLKCISELISSIITIKMIQNSQSNNLNITL